MQELDSIHNRKELKPLRRQLRNNATSAEAVFWKALQGKQLGGKKFRRQHTVGFYILDFYCASERLAIELDGQLHFTDSGVEYDEERTAYLNSLNIKVLRFENKEVFNNIEGILNKIMDSFNPLTTRIGGPTLTPPKLGGERCDLLHYLPN